MMKKKMKFGKEVQSDELLRFLSLAFQLDVIEFQGLLKAMCVEMKDKDGKMKALDFVTSDLIDCYIGLEKAKRKEFFSLVENTVEQNKLDEKNGVKGISDLIEDAAAHFAQNQKEESSIGDNPEEDNL